MAESPTTTPSPDPAAEPTPGRGASALARDAAGRLDWQAIRDRVEAGIEAGSGDGRLSEQELEAVLRRRSVAFASRASRESEDDQGATEVLIVRLQEERYALAVERLAEVVPLRRFTPVPRGPAELLGVFNLRGDVRSIVDLGHVIGHPRETADSHGYVLMIRDSTSTVGLYVDGVEGIRKYRRSRLTRSESSRFVIGLIDEGARLLDVDAVLDHPVFEIQTS